MVTSLNLAKVLKGKLQSTLFQSINFSDSPVQAVLSWQFCLGSPVQAGLCWRFWAGSGYPFLALLSKMSCPAVLSWLSCSAFPVLAVLCWQSCFVSSVLCLVLLALLRLSLSGCPFLIVHFWLSLSGCPFLAVSFWLSCSSCSVQAGVCSTYLRLDTSTKCLKLFYTSPQPILGQTYFIKNVHTNIIYNLLKYILFCKTNSLSEKRTFLWKIALFTKSWL